MNFVDELSTKGIKTSSVWERETEMPDFPRLSGSHEVEVLVIGGGIVGVTCAYELCMRGIDCVLVEGDRICSGVTGHTTAKVTAQHGLTYAKFMKTFGKEKTALYLEANEKARRNIKRLSEEYGCFYDEMDSLAYSMESTEELVAELDALHRVGYPARLATTVELPFETAGAVAFPHQGAIEPIRWVRALTRAIVNQEEGEDFLKSNGRTSYIYERAFVHTVEAATLNGKTGYLAETDLGEVFARKVIVATHYPFLNRHGLYPLKMYQFRSQVMAIAGMQQIHRMYVDGAIGGMSFRPYEDLLLVGGGGHRTGNFKRDVRCSQMPGTGKNASSMANPGYRGLMSNIRKLYPGASVRYMWATQDCMTLDGMPYIGQYGAHTPNLYVATGFNKWGMTGSMVAAELLADLIMEKKNPYEEVFAPSRTIWRKQLFVNAFESSKGFLHLGTKRCSHLGCSLKWNEEEKNWECPCHGSRFADNGKVLDGPAKKKI